MVPEQQQRILGYFIEEATDHLNTIEQGLLNLQSTLNDPDLINEVFRAAHSIKGGAAMLGLNSIQRTSHRLEDCFKVLKDNPVKIDQKLESLFLGVSDTLKALLEHLSGPFGLTEETANTLMAEAEPVFGWLNEHLDKLVKQATDGNETAESTENHQKQVKVENTTAPSANQNRELQAEVMNKLRQMLQLFKQAETKENRQIIQECTDYLAELGDKWNLSSWSNLCRSATSAIAHQENTYLTLAKVVITEIKQALELVLASRENEIVISEQLGALVPKAEIELLEIDSSVVDRIDTELLVQPEVDSYEEIATTEDLHFTENNNQVDVNTQLVTDSVETENNTSNLFELSEQIENNVNPDAPTVIRDLDIHGPEVGLAELNTLADLFEGDSSELDETWQQEEVIDLNSDKAEKGEIVEANIEEAKDNDSEFEDFLLFEEESHKNEQTAVKEEMTIMQLFGEDFLEEDLENLKDTANKEFSSNDLFTSDNLQLVDNEAITNDLLEVSLDDNDKNISEDKLNSILNENNSEQLENNTDNFENLFSETNTDDAAKEIVEVEENSDLPTFENVGLDTLFYELEEPESEDYPRNFLDSSSDMLLENSGNIWEKTQIIPHEDVAKALEESLVEATNSGDIFAEDEALLLDERQSLAFENLDTNLPNASETQFDSISSRDAVDDLLESPLSDEEGFDNNTNDAELFSLEFDNTGQKPVSIEEDLFPNPFEEVNPEENSQQPVSLEEDLFATPFEEANLEENSQQPVSVEEDLFATPFEEVNPEENTQQPVSVEENLFTSSFEETNPEENSQQPVSLEEDLFATPFEETNPEENSQQPVSLEEDLFATPFEEVNPEENTQQPVSVEEDLFATPFEEVNPEENTQQPVSVEEDLFTSSFEEANPEENTQQPVSLEEDLFATPFEEVNLEENTQQPVSVEEDLFTSPYHKDNLLEVNSEDSQINIPDDSFVQEFPNLNIDSEDSSPSLQSSSELEVIEEVNENVSSSPEKLPDITANTQAQLIDDLFAQDIALDEKITLQATSNEKEITFLPFISELTDENQDDENVVETSSLNQLEETNYESLTTEKKKVTEKELQLDEISIADDFSELESLLGEEQIPDTANSDLIADAEFAALEDLLIPDSPQETPTNNISTTTNDKTTSNIGDEFGDLEKLLEQANTSIPRTNKAKPNSPKTTRSVKGEQLMRVPVKHLDNLSNLVGELVVNRNTLEQDQERMRQSLDNLLHQIQNLSDVGARMQELYERSLLEASLLASRKDTGGFGTSNSNSDRGFSELEMDRFTPFHTLSQEMIELIVRVRESASDIDFVIEDNERVARQFRQVTSQLQEGITRSRMEAFSQVTTRLERGVRDNSIKCGKQVQLFIEGQDTLIDKMILQHLTDPLNHILNNAIAHGIETPEERESKGKSPRGTIKIRAFHQGNQTVISVSDDGAGIDAQRVKNKAINVGLITPEQATAMSRIEVYELLFHSGFSTKDEADQLAGRGVGMDVVRTSISEIRGVINTDSKLGKGTTFTIRLPLTLSICKALCCVSDKARIAFPMDGVEDTLDMPVKNIQEQADGKKYIFWRDTKLPFRPLKELLTFNRLLSRGNVYGGNRDDDMLSVIVVRSANTMIALQIDQVLSEQEIVIKQFEGPAPKPIGVAGATVLGDGRIMPIVDVLELIDIFEGRTSKQSSVSLWDQKDTLVPVETAEAKIDPTVLIVDDSITVRELLSLTFSKAGYRVEQARDGQEAWDKLRSGLPCDIVFCDIEMPRCDGLELLSRIQKDDDLNNLPIAMLTSRGADKHRQMAIQLGASGYFTKPYLEEALLEAAVRMLKGEKLVNSNASP